MPTWHFLVERARGGSASPAVLKCVYYQAGPARFEVPLACARAREGERERASGCVRCQGPKSAQEVLLFKEVFCKHLSSKACVRVRERNGESEREPVCACVHVRGCLCSKVSICRSSKLHKKCQTQGNLSCKCRFEPCMWHFPSRQLQLCGLGSTVRLSLMGSAVQCILTKPLQGFAPAV